MNWHSFMHGAGVGCLICIAAIAVAMLVEALVPNWRRILTALRGNPARGFVPLSPTASVLPLRTSLPPLRAVEADAQPTQSERAA